VPKVLRLLVREINAMKWPYYVTPSRKLPGTMAKLHGLLQITWYAPT